MVRRGWEWAEPWITEPRRAAWLVVVALIAGLLVRVYASGLTLFGGDLGICYRIAQDIAHGRSFPAIGAQATWGGNVPFPGFFYLIAVPFLVTDSALLFTLWGALLCTAGLLPFVRLLWERWGPRAAVYGAWLVATTPWLLVHSDAPESPNLSVPCAALELYAIHRVLTHPRSRWAAVVPVAFALHAHLYPTLPVMVLAGLAIWWATPRPRPPVAWGWFGLGLGLAGLSMLPSLIYLAQHGLGPLGSWSRTWKMDWPRELVNAAYDSFAFATAELSHWLNLGFWRHFDIRTWTRELPDSLGQTYGWGLGSYVIVNFLVVLTCWVVGGWRTLRTMLRERRRPGPFALALAVSVVASVLLMLVVVKPYEPRYNIVILWVTLLPLILAAAHRGRAAGLLWLFLVLAVPGNLLVAHRYYTVTVPPHGVRTMSAALELIDREQQGQPFELTTEPARRVLAAIDTVARETYGDRWQRKPQAAVRYHTLPPAPRQSPAQRKLLATPGGTSWPLPHGVLLRVPVAKR